MLPTSEIADKVIFLMLNEKDWGKLQSFFVF